MNVEQKIALRRKAINKALKTRARNQRSREYAAKWADTKVKARVAWNNTKDILLLLILLNTFIGTMQKIDLDQLTAPRTVTITNEAHAQTKVTPEPTEPVKAQQEAKTATFTAYNAEVGQTDADPFTMASGKKVYDGAIANNCLPFGTKIKINGKVKIVEDRMNSRYDCDHFDIFMNSYDEAISFGKRELTYEVI